MSVLRIPPNADLMHRIQRARLRNWLGFFIKVGVCICSLSTPFRLLRVSGSESALLGAVGTIAKCFNLIFDVYQ